MKRSAIAVWQGSGKEGKGHLTTQSKVLNQNKYSAGSRFSEDPGTNPEELIAAAHAGCFTMKLSFNLSNAGFIPDNLETKCIVTLEDGVVTSSQLATNAKVKGIKKEQFASLIEDARVNCPISKLLDTVISVEYELDS